MLQATSSLADLNALLPRPIYRQGDYESLVGLLLGRFGCLPAEGEKTTFDGYEATILAKVGNSIERVQLPNLTVHQP